MNHYIKRLSIYFVTLLIMAGCAKESDVEPEIAATLATVKTTDITDITFDEALSGGNVKDDGGSRVTTRGICWSKHPNPTSDSTRIKKGQGTGTFTTKLFGLSMGTTYYVRAYAKNSAGTAYGNELVFETLSGSLPTLTTSDVTNIDLASATCGGDVSAHGGLPVIARGVCWDTTSGPTISLSTKTSNGTGTGSFTSELSDLIPGTTYYVRAYATNDNGTEYGDEVSFETTYLNIGDDWAGGKVIEIFNSSDPRYDPNVPHGLIASDLMTGYEFGCNAMVVGTSINSGTGPANTASIVAACGTNNAAGLCDNLSQGGFTDWYLPSANTLKSFCSDLIYIGVPTSSKIWSSSEHLTINTGAYYVPRSGCIIVSAGKTENYDVIAVRVF